MNLIKLINKYKNKVVDKFLLVEYDLFFDNSVNEYCKFVIDDYKELKKLNNIILKIKDIDKSSKIYVNTYELDFINEKIFIYTDTLWINTIINLEDILKLFKNTISIEPSNISLLIDKNKDIYEIPDIVILLDDIEDYNIFSKRI